MNRSTRTGIVMLFGFGLCTAWGCGGEAAESSVPRLDPRRAFDYLQQVCDIGPRISGTEGMTRQQDLLIAHFEKLGARVALQPFDARHPQTGQPVRMNNLIVSWHPETQQRLLVCCHYDTRPRPDRELLPSNRDKPFIGANDGGSGVALLMELGHHLPTAQTKYGVDFVFFDAEELVYSSRDKYFLGSEFFATDYRDRPPAWRYRAGVLLDMIGDKNLRIYMEGNSVKLAPAVTQSVWETAASLGVREFVSRRKHEVSDDHLPLNQIAGIPTCDVIDFDYPHWHTRNDLPSACSGESLATVGRVILAWLQSPGGI